MIYFYITKYIGNKQYIAGSLLRTEAGTPCEPYEFSKPFPGDLLNENGKPQWAIRENPDYDSEKDHIDDRYIIECDPILPTAEEIAETRAQVIKAKIQAELPGLIYQYRDNPAGLAQALCSRAKAIEVETK